MRSRLCWLRCSYSARQPTSRKSGAWFSVQRPRFGTATCDSFLVVIDYGDDVMRIWREKYLILIFRYAIFTRITKIKVITHISPTLESKTMNKIFFKNLSSHKLHIIKVIYFNYSLVTFALFSIFIDCAWSNSIHRYICVTSRIKIRFFCPVSRERFLPGCGAQARE